ncbi:hypothetical protein MHYP_G00273620 [Metynnis hypsauchen]
MWMCVPAERDKRIPTEPRVIRKNGCTMSSRLLLRDFKSLNIHNHSQTEAKTCLSAGCILSDALGEEVCLHPSPPEEEGQTDNSPER